MRYHNHQSNVMRLVASSSRVFKSVVKTLLLLVFVTTYSGCALIEKSSSDGVEVKTQETPNTAEQQAFDAIVVAHKNGDLVRAEQGYDEFLVRYPNNVSARINLAHIALQTKNTDLAEQRLSEVLKLEPTNAQALTLSGVISREKGEFDAAEASYRTALAARPDYVPAIRNLGILLDLYRGRLPEALEYYERAQSLEEEPDPKLKDWIFDIKRRIGE